MPSILGRDEIDRFQNFESPQRDIVEIADRRGDHVKHGEASDQNGFRAIDLELVLRIRTSRSPRSGDLESPLLEASREFRPRKSVSVPLTQSQTVRETLGSYPVQSHGA